MYDEERGYDIVGEPTAASERAASWRLAKGLQAVDGLKTSEYLEEVANGHIAGKYDIDDAIDIVAKYYETKGVRSEQARTKEADIVSARIVKLVTTNSFSFYPGALNNIHKALFQDVDPTFRAGKYRTVNLSKKEPVLAGRSVVYADFREIDGLLKYDFQSFQINEMSFNDKESVRQLSRFISGIWQTHPFMEGNTRTVAVFCQRLLRSMGIDVESSVFEQSSLYFRNALVLSNYASIKDGINPDFDPLDRFFENAVLNAGHELKNRTLYRRDLYRIEGLPDPIEQFAKHDALRAPRPAPKASRPESAKSPEEERARIKASPSEQAPTTTRKGKKI